MKPPKMPISDADMLVLLHKYPFLKHRNVWTRKQIFHGKSQNLADNYYKYWDGSGWEVLWKKYLSKLFAEYDKWSKKDQKAFQFLQIKEKFGELRIYTSGSTDRLEGIAESLSNWTCEYCGAEPRENGKRVIWTSYGWITHMCEHCAREHVIREAEVELDEETIQERLDELKKVQERPFGYVQFNKDRRIYTTYKETPDGWLEVDEVKELTKEEYDELFNN